MQNLKTHYDIMRVGRPVWVEDLVHGLITAVNTDTHKASNPAFIAIAMQLNIILCMLVNDA